MSNNNLRKVLYRRAELFIANQEVDKFSYFLARTVLTSGLKIDSYQTDMVLSEMLASGLLVKEGNSFKRSKIDAEYVRNAAFNVKKLLSERVNALESMLHKSESQQLRLELEKSKCSAIERLDEYITGKGGVDKDFFNITDLAFIELSKIGIVRNENSLLQFNHIFWPNVLERLYKLLE